MFALVATAIAVLVVIWLLVAPLRKRAPPVGHITPPLAPGGHPILGHLLCLAKPQLHRELVKWANACGPVYSLSLGMPVVVVADAAVATAIITRGPAYMPKAKAIYAATTSELAFGDPTIFNAEDSDPAWSIVRKAVAPCFSTDNLKRAYPHLLACAERLADLWQQDVEASGSDRRALVHDVDDWMKRCVMDGFMAAGLRLPMDSLADRHHDFLHNLHEMLLEFSLRIGNPLRLPFQRLTPFLPSTRKIKRAGQEYRAHIVGIMTQLEARGPPADDDHTIGATLLRLQQPAGPLTRNGVLGNLATFVVGGFDTTAATLAWALYNIARHERVQAKLVEELRGAGRLHVAGQPPPAPLTYADLSSMPYLSTVIKESMRVCTTAATGTFRQAHQDTVLGGKYWVPSGSLVWVPFAPVHESNVNFVRPEEFIPERWLDTADGVTGSDSDGVQGSGPTLQGLAAPGAKSWIPFSEGPRNCVGMAFANMNLRLVLATLLSRFWLSVSPDMGSPEAVRDAQAMALVMVSGVPIRLLIEPHSA